MSVDNPAEYLDRVMSGVLAEARLAFERTGSPTERIWGFRYPEAEAVVSLASENPAGIFPPGRRPELKAALDASGADCVVWAHETHATDSFGEDIGTMLKVSAVWPREGLSLTRLVLRRPASGEMVEADADADADADGVDFGLEWLEALVPAEKPPVPAEGRPTPAPHASSSVPPQVGTTEDNAASRRMDAAIMAFIGVLMLICAFAWDFSGDHSTCDGREMSPGDSCIRSGKGDSYGYEDIERLDAENERTGTIVFGVVAGGCLVIALVQAVRGRREPGEL